MPNHKMHYISTDEINPTIRISGVHKPNISPSKRRIILDYELILCRQGRLDIIYDDFTCNLAPNEIALIPPSKYHYFKSTKNLKAHYIHFDFINYPNREELLNNIGDGWISKEDVKGLKTYTIPRPLILLYPDLSLPYKFTPSKNLAPIFIEIVELNKIKTNKINQLKCKQLIISIILEILPFLKPSNVKEQSHEQLIHNVKNYIAKNIYLPLNVREVANIFHYHPDTLTRIFKAYENTSISSYIMTSKINSSKELLMASDMTIEDISKILGYSDRSYFSKVFKKVTGFSPSHFRENPL